MVLIGEAAHVFLAMERGWGLLWLAKLPKDSEGFWCSLPGDCDAFHASRVFGKGTEVYRQSADATGEAKK